MLPLLYIFNNGLSEKNDFGFKYKVRTFIIFTKAHIKPIVTKPLDFNNNKTTDYQLFTIQFCDIIEYLGLGIVLDKGYPSNIAYLWIAEDKKSP